MDKENQSDLSDSFNLADFLSSESESDIAEEHEDGEINSEITENLKRVTQMQIQDGLSYKTSSNILKSMNRMPNTTIKLPENKKTVKKQMFTQLMYSFKVLLYCTECDQFVEDKSKCSQCSKLYQRDSKKNNFIIYFPLEPQIRRMLNEYFNEVFEHLNRDTVDSVLTDVDDGLLYKKIKEKYPHVINLGFTANADGANIHKSSSSSLWPLQLYANFLPPTIRFLPKNIILSTMYYGKKKPNMTRLFYHLAEELDSLSKNFITIHKDGELFTFRPTLHLCVCDLPARADLQNFKGPTGKFGCAYCYHPGTAIKNLAGKTTTRYNTGQSTKMFNLRTHNETILHAQQVTSDSLYGVKGFSALLLFDDINVIDSVAIDFMHGWLLGIVKMIVEIWLGKKRIPTPEFKDYKIKSNELRKCLEQRILRMKPHTSFNRKPRSIFEISNFKASELMYLLWYYLRYAIVGILPTKVVKNFEKLSAASYILCQKEIKFDEARKACRLLVDFADEFEQIYGAGAVTMNIHLCKHFENTLFNCGPLWACCMFGFESKIGDLRKQVKGTTDILLQIAMKYQFQNIAYQEKTSDDNRTSGPCLLQETKIRLKPEYIVAFGEIMSREVELKIWRRLKMRGEIYSCTQATSTKSIDYFIRTSNDKIGIIHFFLRARRSQKLCSSCTRKRLKIIIG